MIDYDCGSDDEEFLHYKKMMKKNKGKGITQPKK